MPPALLESQLLTLERDPSLLVVSGMLAKQCYCISGSANAPGQCNAALMKTSCLLASGSITRIAWQLALFECVAVYEDDYNPRVGIHAIDLTGDCHTQVPCFPSR